MKKSILLALACTAILSSVTSFAQAIQAQVSLKKLVAEKLSERNFDQIYMGVTDVSKKAYQYYRLPGFPLHWIMKKNAQVNNQLLWSAPIQEGETVTLQFTLAEQDTSRFDVDDLIGIAQVSLKNDHGQLTTTWSIPKNLRDGAINVQQIGTSSKYEFSGDNSKYQIEFAADKEPVQQLNKLQENHVSNE